MILRCVPADKAEPGPSSGTVPLTVYLSKEHMRALRNLGELYHATPEHMVAVWAVHQIERLAAGLVPDEGPDPAPETFTTDP